MFQIDVTQILDLSADRGRASDRVQTMGRSLVQASAAMVERGAKGKAPVDTGALRSSIHTQLGDGGMSASIAPGVHYAVYLEYGTRRMAAQPFMGPAFQGVIPMFVEGVAQLGGDFL